MVFYMERIGMPRFGKSALQWGRGRDRLQVPALVERRQLILYLCGSGAIAREWISILMRTGTNCCRCPRLNGAYKGLNDRVANFKRALKTLNAPASQAAANRSRILASV